MMIAANALAMAERRAMDDENSREYYSTTSTLSSFKLLKFVNGFAT